MAQEIETSCGNNSPSFNEHENKILFIMFLAVLAFLFIVGIRAFPCMKNQGDSSTQTTEINTPISMQHDSLSLKQLK